MVRGGLYSRSWLFEIETFGIESNMVDVVGLVDLTRNYFELFQLPVSCEVDARKLTSYYRELQKTIHPDRFVGDSERQQRLSVQYAAHVNEAFNTLKEPLSRAVYLLKLSGRDLDMENNTVMDPAFLMEQMELREAASDLKTEDRPKAEFDRLMSRVEEGIEAILSQFRGLWQSGTDQDLDQAETVVRKLQFMVKLAAELEQLEFQWLDG
ncbi:MAG: Fe-S protein assembly co-chaperone HscB [Endozoicomonas sp.]